MSDEQLLNDLKAARHKAAHLAIMDRVYTPQFARIEREIAAIQAERALLERAKEGLRLGNDDL
jgi:hypothetical protein